MCTCWYKLQRLCVCTYVCVSRVCATPACCLSPQRRPKVAFQLCFMAAGGRVGHGAEWIHRPVSNKAAALLPPWRHPGCTTAAALPRFMAVGQDVSVLSAAARIGPSRDTLVFHVRKRWRVAEWNDDDDILNIPLNFSTKINRKNWPKFWFSFTKVNISSTPFEK